MSPQDRARAQGEAGMASLRKMQEDRARQAADDLDRKAEALNSPRVGNQVVAETALAWLKKTGALPTEGEITLAELAVSIVHAMIFDSTLAISITSLMESWLGWMDLPMTDVHLAQVQSNMVHFCYAAVLVNQIVQEDGNFVAPFLAREKTDVGVDGLLVVVTDFGDNRCTRAHA